MRELTKSMFRLSWAASLYGAEKIYRRLRPADAVSGAQETAARPAVDLHDLSPDPLSWKAAELLGPGFREAFQAGAAWQEEWVDEVATALAEDGIPGAASSAGRLPSETLRFFGLHPSGAAVRQEFRNRFEAYRLVSSVRDWLHLPPPGTSFDLKTAVEEALRIDRHRALWAIEGLGHAYGEAALRAGEPRGLLSRDEFSDLPEASLAMLHAGIGLAFAKHQLATLSRASDRDEVRSAVEHFARLCAGNARPGLLFGSLEALGLIARGLRPELIPALEEALVTLDDGDLHSHVWHGIGRAMYFAPVQFVPGVGTIWHALEMARREASTQAALDAAVVGVGMASTLVNLSHPEVVEHLFTERGDELDGRLGMRFFEGLVSAVVLRHDHSPDPLSLEAFLRHRPASGSRAAEIWEHRLRRACEQALAADDPADRALPPVLRLSCEDRAVPFTLGNATILQLLGDSASPPGEES